MGSPVFFVPEEKKVNQKKHGDFHPSLAILA